MYSGTSRLIASEYNKFLLARLRAIAEDGWALIAAQIG